LTIEASRLPNNSFGYFITSPAQANIHSPGQGVLCLGGQIGRFIGPGQVKNTGAVGSFSLRVNFSQIPTPTGFAAAVVGQPQNFQAWHRDALGGFPVTNFTNGLALTFQQ
jgi:hypothetical protein